MSLLRKNILDQMKLIIYWEILQKQGEVLNWKPSVDFKGLVKIMVEHDINEAKKDFTLLKDNLISPTWEYPKL